MIPDRSLIPPLIIPESVNITEAVKVRLNNGLSLYVINAGSEEVVRFEIIFPAGAYDANSHSVSSACHQLIDAGTSSKKALEIAESLDFYGAYLQTDAGADWKNICLFSITRFFDETIEIVNEIISDPVFPDDEIETWITRNIQTLKVNREKVSWLSKSAFNSSVYGKNHPYGFTTSEEDFEKINSNILKQFYSSGYDFNNAILIVSGKVTDKIIEKINSVFGGKTLGTTGHNPLNMIPVETYIPGKLYIEKKDSVQSGLRIGKQLFTKKHPDYIKLSIVNTIFGGYFGSRLMSNIREDKGYTYGIGSGVMPMHNSGAFFISTEVGNDVREAAIKEIYFEINRLINEPVHVDELLLVKNYLFGSFQRSIDGPFGLADRFKGLILHDLDYDYVKKYLKTVKDITPSEINEIAAKHLQPDTMSEIVAG